MFDWLKNLFKKEYKEPSYVPLNSFPQINTGVLDGKQDTDYIAGASPIPYEVVLPSGDWRPFMVIGERQNYQTFDSMGCTGYSNNNSAEIQLKQSTGFEYNFSDEALNYLAGCTPKGNFLYKPADTARTQGRILQKDWSLPNSLIWEDLQKPIPEEILNKAIFFKESYQWITDKSTLKYRLKQAPIQVIVDNNSHAVVLLYVDNFYWYMDSYPPYLKKTSAIGSALQIIVKPMTQFVHLQGTQEYGLYVASKDIESLKANGEKLGMPFGNSIPFNKAKDIKFL